MKKEKKPERPVISVRVSREVYYLIKLHRLDVAEIIETEVTRQFQRSNGRARLLK